MNKVEILAPVGSMEALEAAVRCGADAVYLGQKNFSARKNSQNFDEEELREAVAYAHRCGVQVHQALNILVFDHEFDALKCCIKAACQAGVDALIVQDLGVASIVKTLAPQMLLHASTQMAVYSPAGVKAAEELGFSRVVLARELAREEIARIRQSTSLELEVFVHGAHCMCVSGQCYMSALFGGKSGNRGQCAQPCRLPFTAEGQGKNVLSLKDMSLVDKLPLLQEMGVNSVKIEGRMKRPEYVAAAVTACRRALDGEKPDLDTLQAVFSRSGFTSGYFDAKVDKTMFGFRKKEDVVSANEVFKPLAQLYHKQTPLVPVSMAFSMKRGGPIRLEIRDPDGHVVRTEGEISQEALNLSATADFAKKFLSKLGGTPYYLENFEAHIEDGLTLPPAAFNGVRRKAVEKLDQLRQGTSLKFLERPLPEIESIAQAADPVYWGKFRLYSQIPWEKEPDLNKILLPLNEVEIHQKELFPYLEKIILVPPRFVFQAEEKVQAQLKRLKESGFSSLYCDNLSHITLGRQTGMKLFGGPFLNLSNSHSLQAAKDLGLQSTVISIEEKLDWMRKLQTPLATGIVGYGYLPLMSVRNCPIKAQIGCKACGQKGYLVDRKGFHFPVRCDGEVSFIYNTLPLSISDRQQEFSKIHFILLDFTIEGKEQAKEIIEAFHTEKKLEQECTRGLYYRGVE